MSREEALDLIGKLPDTAPDARNALSQQQKKDLWALIKDTNFKHDRDVVMLAVRKEPNCLRWAGDALKNDRSFMIEMAKNKISFTLGNASKELKKDKTLKKEIIGIVATRKTNYRIRFEPGRSNLTGHVIASFPGECGTVWDMLQGAESQYSNNLKFLIEPDRFPDGSPNWHMKSETFEDYQKRRYNFTSRMDKGLRTACVFLPPGCPEDGKHTTSFGDDRCYCNTRFEEGGLEYRVGNCFFPDVDPNTGKANVDPNHPERVLFGCEWFSVWKNFVHTARDNGCTFWVVTKADGSQGRSQQGEVAYLEALDGIVVNTVTITDLLSDGAFVKFLEGED